MKSFLRPQSNKPDRLPVTRYAVLLFLLAVALTSAVAVTLVRNADRSTWQQNATALAAGAHLGASSFGALRSNLRVKASQLAASLELQRAVVTQDHAALERIATVNHARITLAGYSIGTLAPRPRIASIATIADRGNVLATITVALPLDKNVLTLLRQSMPLPAHAGLLLLHDGTVVAGGPIGANPRLGGGRTVLGGVPFAAQQAPLGIPHGTVLAVEPVAAIDAISARYRRLVYLAAALTLVLVAALATRLARPIAQVVGEVAHLSRQAQTDALTGLANRRALSERLEVEIARAEANGTSVSFVIADIDDFKAINDTHGHQTGDEILRATARALSGSVRELDLAARYGGEEFAIVLPGSSLANAHRSAERMRQAIGEIALPSPSGQTAVVTMSFGVAEFPTYANADSLVAAADAALYQAKRGGKNAVATATVQHVIERAEDESPVKLVSVV